MLKIAICDDGKVDVEQLETAFGAVSYTHLTLPTTP